MQVQPRAESARAVSRSSVVLPAPGGPKRSTGPGCGTRWRTRSRSAGRGIMLLKAHFHRELDLARGKGLLVQPVGDAALRVRLRIRREGAAAEDVVDLAVIRAVEEVEGFDDALEGELGTELEATAQARVDDELALHRLAVAPHARRAVGGIAPGSIGGRAAAVSV